MADNGISGSLLELADNVHGLSNKVDAQGRKIDALDYKLDKFAKGQTRASRWGAFFGAALAGAGMVGLDHCVSKPAPAQVVQQ